MVLLLKQWKSRSSPGFAGGVVRKPIHDVENAAVEPISRRRFCFRGYGLTDVGAGWSSPVARQAHNLKVAGSNPAPATNQEPAFERAFLCLPSVAVGPLAMVGDVEPFALRIPRMPERHHRSDDPEA